MKPLGRKSYGSIPHLSSSKLGPGDYHCHEGQERIATVKARDKHDIIIVQEKLDGGNVGICKVGDKILAITRAGYLATTSPFETHHIFDEWVKANEKRFDELLAEGERVCGEWLYHAVGTRYNLPHEPFVGFDLMMADQRKSYFEVKERLEKLDLVLPNTIHVGSPISVTDALNLLGAGAHGAIDPVEGLIYRVERKGEVDFLVKYVRPGKENGIYFPEISGGELIVNGFS
jgi:RNA ligase